MRPLLTAIALLVTLAGCLGPKEAPTTIDFRPKWRSMWITDDAESTGVVETRGSYALHAAEVRRHMKDIGDPHADANRAFQIQSLGTGEDKVILNWASNGVSGTVDLRRRLGEPICCTQGRAMDQLEVILFTDSGIPFDAKVVDAGPSRCMKGCE